MALAFTPTTSIEVKSFSEQQSYSEQLPNASFQSDRSSRSRASSNARSFSFASCSSFDFDGFDVSQPCSSQGSLKIKNTFIHVDREFDDSDDELAMPCKCASAPNVESCTMTPNSALKGKRQASRACEITPKADVARTPKVTFDLCPSFFGVVQDRQTIPDASVAAGSDGPLQVAELKASGEYEVKNTFIHLDKSRAADSDNCDLPTRSISDPARMGALSPCRVRVSKDGPAYIVDSQIAEFGQLPSCPNSPIGLPLEMITPPSIDSWPSPPSDGASSLGSSSFRVKNTFIHVDVDADPAMEDDCGLMMPVKSISQPELMRERDSDMTAAEESHSLPSIGAMLHGSGQCKPCAWFWKPEGCQWGRECGHCHLCPVGELRRRKKEKQAEAKATKALLRQQQQQAS